MSKIMTWCTGLALIGAVAGCGQPAARTAGSWGRAIGSWGKAIEVPGLAALNTGRDASVTTMSCASAGNCAAGGDYADHRGYRSQGFVAVERDGVWGKAIAVPGLGALNTGGDGELDSVSCGSAGNCAAGGYYSGSHSQQGFVAVERNGRWGAAIEVPGLGALNKAGDADVLSVSCGSAGSCVAGGYYGYSQIGERGFVAVERNGRWGTAIEVPGLAALDKDGYARVNSVSCASAGNCAVGGSYTFHGGEQGAFVASERNSRWAKAIAVPGLGALNKGEFAWVSSVSCASAGNCAAGGAYGDRHGNDQGFVAAERNGRWGKAIEVPGLGALNKRGDAQVLSVSCGSAGSCAAGGIYDEQRDVHGQGFVAVERNGRWGTAIRVPGLAALNKGGGVTQVLTVSCASAGNCAAGGYYFDRPDHHTWFVAVERNGRWGTAIEVPGLKALNKGTDGVDVSGSGFSVSCAPAGTCAAGGYYTDASGHVQGFVTQAG
ncbi:MAG: hypothetical protein ACLPUO_10065 [Streptosporangiaceae bacterium]|jgi:hypothetical protein